MTFICIEHGILHGKFPGMPNTTFQVAQTLQALNLSGTAKAREFCEQVSFGEMAELDRLVLEGLEKVKSHVGELLEVRKPQVVRSLFGFVAVPFRRARI